MILKMRTQGPEKGIGWKMIDGIKQINYKYMDEPKELTPNAIYINTYPDLPDKRVTEITISYKDGNVEKIYTDDAVYIMNDDGKTCDTINI